VGSLKNNQDGLSAIEGVLILLIVVIVIFTGWYVYNANKKTNSLYNSANQNLQSTANFAKDKKPATKP
jgi:uncharacterized protein (UPF0333 family)